MSKVKKLYLCSVFLAVVYLYLGFCNWLEPTEVGIAKNVITGRVWLQARAGLHLTPFYVCVTRIDCRPIRVGVESDSRSACMKLVSFNPKYWETFVKTEGWRYYWWSNRISFNLGYKEEYRGLKDVLRGYAFSPTEYPFISVTSITESKNENQRQIIKE